MTTRPVQVDLTVIDGDVQTITLTSRIEKQAGPAGWDLFEQAKLLVEGLGKMLGQGQLPRPENREYPGQPGEKLDGARIEIGPDSRAVLRLRAKLDERAGKGMDPMFDAEIRAILDGDAADDEPMTTGELDRAGMYGGNFTSIQQANRHVFPSMLGGSECNRCGITRSQALVSTNGRWCTGTMNTRPA